MAASHLQQEIRKRQPFDSPHEEALLNIRRTSSRLSNQVERLLKTFGVSEAQYNALRILRGAREGGQPSLPCLEVAHRMIAAVPDITRLIDRLHRAGLVQRTRDRDDGRVVLIAITRPGLDLLARIDKPLQRLVSTLLQHMTSRELATLNQLLVKARNNPDG